MPHIPTPIRAALGLAATAVAEARKLPETLPQLPVTAISTAMQASLRVQQHIATYAARGDEVISLIRGTSPEPPSWATFDDTPDAGTAQNGRPAAAFDRIQTQAANLEDTAAGLFGDETDFDQPLGYYAEPLESAEPLETAEPLDGSVDEGEPGQAEPAHPVKAAKAAAKKAPAKKAAAKKALGKKAAAKKAPAKRPPVSEPLEEAAAKADPSGPPTPSTMAAEILHAHEAEANHEADGPAAGPDGAPSPADQ